MTETCADFLKRASEIGLLPLIKTDVKMSEYTTFKIGGVSDLAIFPKSVCDVEACVTLAHETHTPFFVVGRGSNLLVADEGFRGLIIFTSALDTVEFCDNKVTAMAGANLTALSKMAGERGLSGLEFAYGIPGSVGGAVYMNAGAYGGEMKDVVEKTEYYSATDGFGTLLLDEHNFGYRDSAYMNTNRVILSATMTLCEGNREEIEEKQREYMSRRIEKQPLDAYSAGSSFKRYPGRFTGQMIEEAGLKGFRVGGASVSMKHAGFIVNDGGATAKDVIELAGEIRKRIFEKEGIVIESEIRYLSSEGEKEI